MNLKNISSTIQLNNEVQMPALGLGVYKMRSGEEVINSVGYALDSGYRLIDTASYYRNEKDVGEAIKNSGIPREDIFVTTKVWNDEQGYETTLRAFDKSLNALGRIDLYLIHWPVSGKFIETWKALETLYKQKRVRAIGLSNCLQHHLEKIMEYGEIKPMILQNEFHPRLLQQSLLNFCKRNNIQYQAWSPLMRGRILDHQVFKDLSEKYRKTPAQIIIRWDLQKGVATIPKSVHQERILENADVFDFELSVDDISLIDALDNQERTGAHPDHFMEHFAKKN